MTAGVGSAQVRALRKGLKAWACVAWGMWSLAGACQAAQPTYRVGETIFIETGVEAPDRNPTW